MFKIGHHSGSCFTVASPISVPPKLRRTSFGQCGRSWATVSSLAELTPQSESVASCLHIVAYQPWSLSLVRLISRIQAARAFGSNLGEADEAAASHFATPQVQLYTFPSIGNHWNDLLCGTQMHATDLGGSMCQVCFRPCRIA